MLDSEGIQINISVQIRIGGNSTTTSIYKYPVQGGQVVFTTDVPVGTISLSLRVWLMGNGANISAYLIYNN